MSAHVSIPGLTNGGRINALESLLSHWTRALEVSLAANRELTGAEWQALARDLEMCSALVAEIGKP